MNIKQLKEFSKKQKKEQYKNKEDDRASTSTTQDVEEVIQEETVQEGREQAEIEDDNASTTQDVEDVKIEHMDIDEDELITEKTCVTKTYFRRAGKRTQKNKFG